MTDLQQDQIEAFDAAAELASNTLTKDGKTATVIAGAVVNSRMLRETGYLRSQVSPIDIKRADFDRLKIAESVVVDLDGQKLRVLIVNDDKADAIVGITLGPMR